MANKNEGFKKRLAVHEAGHVLLMAGYSELPTLICASIDYQSDKNSYEGSGFVWHYVEEFKNLSIEELKNLNTAHIELLMLQHLAGYVAEWQMNTCQQTNQADSSSDLKSWDQLYLCLAEKSKDIKAKNLLKREQEQQLDVFMKQNLDVLYKLADSLVEKELVFYDIIQPIIKKVVYPKHFPIVKAHSVVVKALSADCKDALGYDEQVFLAQYRSLSEADKLAFQKYFESLKSH